MLVQQMDQQAGAPMYMPGPNAQSPNLGPGAPNNAQSQQQNPNMCNVQQFINI